MLEFIDETIELNTKKIKEILKTTGHWDFPFGEPRQTGPIEHYDLWSEEVRIAIESYQDFMREPLEQITAEMYPSRLSPAPRIDGRIDSDGPTEALLKIPRCWVPDYTGESRTAEAVGSGNWKRCHGIGEFHAASVRITNSPPAFLAPLFDEVLKRVVQAYDEVGLRFYFAKPGETPKEPRNIDFSFVGSSPGWIGLAMVVNNATCQSSPIWCRYLATYRGGNTEAAIINQWVSLVKHELCHNCGIGHTSGGVMNPSILTGLPTSWRNDVAWPMLAQRFGGVAVPSPGPGPGPDPDDQWHELKLRSKSRIEIVT